MNSGPGLVLYLTTGLGSGGAEAMLLKLLIRLRPAGAAVVSLKDAGSYGSRIQEVGVPVHALGIRGPAQIPMAAVTLRRLVREIRPDLVHGWMYHGSVAALAAAAVGRGRIPVVWNIRQSLGALHAERRMTRGVIRLAAALSSRATSIVYNATASAAQHAAFGFAAGRSVILPNGFDTDRYRPDGAARLRVRAELGIPADALIVGLVGRWHPVKDHGTFVRAASIMGRQVPECFFVLAGSGVTAGNEALRQLIESVGLPPDRVRLLGNVKDTAPLTASFDVAACSSISEAFPNVLGEAMATGVPCVCTDVGDARRILGEAGAIVQPGRPQEFAQACVEILRAGEGHRRLLGERGRARIIDQFSIGAVADQYSELYCRILATPSRLGSE